MGILVAGAGGLACASSGPTTPSTRITVAQANAQSGDGSWFVPVGQRAPQTQLALWASPYAPRYGDVVDIYIHATQGPVTVTIFRMGWYGGLGGHAVATQSGVAAAAQPPCSSESGPVVCRWTKTLSVPVGSDWVSGVYLIKATDNSGKSAFYPFVLTDTRPAQFVAVVAQFSWQAYNTYGGMSLYTPGQSTDSGEVSGSLGHFVSFERPYAANGGASYILDDYKSHDLRDLRFLERNGYDVTYVSDVDLTEVSRGLPQPAKGLLFIGHDEYWTFHERSVVQRMRDDQHTHLAFLSGNDAYWNVRLSSGQVTGRPGDVITCYKLDPDPGAPAESLTTTQFRRQPLDRPEDHLMGVEYVVGTQTFPLQPLVVSDTAIGPEAAAFLAAAGLKPGDQIPQQIGIEGDRIVPDTSSPPNLQVLFRSPIAPKFGVPYAPYYYTTFFVAPSGAGVFTAGDVEWGRGLDGFNGTVESPALQAVTNAVLHWMQAH